MESWEDKLARWSLEDEVRLAEIAAYQIEAARNFVKLSNEEQAARVLIRVAEHLELD